MNTRTEELDERLKRFSSLLDESLHAAEDRARDVARLVAEATSEGARSIAEQHAAIRSTTEEQSKRTLDSLHDLYEQVSTESKNLFQQNAGEAHQLLQQATDRFADIMQTMKQMSADMQRELDNTRQELRRGVLELPEETAESTAQMRRVIVDQMEALAELNRIVARHGRAMDTVATATEQLSAKRGYRDEQPAMAGAVARQESARGGGRAEQAGPPRGRVEAPPVAPAGQNVGGQNVAPAQGGGQAGPRRLAVGAADARLARRRRARRAPTIAPRSTARRARGRAAPGRSQRPPHHRIARTRCRSTSPA